MTYDINDLLYGAGLWLVALGLGIWYGVHAGLIAFGAGMIVAALIGGKPQA